MNTPTLGKLICGKADCDAVHVAIAPVKAGVTLSPGEHVSVTNGTASSAKPHIGVVDPFLIKGSVQPGQWFWLLLYPNTVTSLRHEWTHPAFTPSKEAEELRRICVENGIDYEDLIEKGPSGVYAGEETYHLDRTDFWDLYQCVTGKVVPSDERYIRCAC